MSTSSTPNDAVLAWWRAWQEKDVRAIQTMALDEYIEYSGTGNRPTLGRERLTEVALKFFAVATIEDWSIEEIAVREQGGVAVCMYRWSERGVRNGEQFEAAGLATDVLAHSEGGWQYLAHHVSTLP